MPHNNMSLKITHIMMMMIWLLAAKNILRDIHLQGEENAGTNNSVK